MNPRISVLIPTREHAETLKATLQTCVAQDYDELEILVSDNASVDGTRDVVEGFRDERIRYINTQVRLSMTGNWEFALANVTGDYVTVVGDDDALLPGAVGELAGIIEQTKTKAITWNWVAYYWPSSVTPEIRDLMLIPCGHGIEERRAGEVLRRVLDFTQGHEQLPFLYRGIVSRDAIERVKRSSGGIFYRSLTPDVYSAVVLALTIDRYYFSSHPHSIAGSSGGSQGASQFNPHINPVERNRFVGENTIPFHPDLVYAPSLPIIVAETFLQAKPHFEEAKSYSFSVEKMMRAAMKEVQASPRARYEEVSRAVAQIGARHGLESSARKAIGAHPNFPGEVPVALVPGYNFVRDHFIIDCKQFGAYDVNQAGLLARSFLAARRAGTRRSSWSTLATTARIGFGLCRRWIERLRILAVHRCSKLFRR